MASGRIDESQNSSDEEQVVFAGFTIEEIGNIRQARQTRQEQNLLRDVDSEIEDFFELRSQERGSNSDVELYASGEEEESDVETSDEESAPEENPPNALQWSSTLREINVRQFSIRHGPTSDLGDNATAKDFFSLFLDDAYIDEIVRFTVAYARSKGDRTFTTTRAYLGLNILIGIHELPQLAMYWDSDEFFGVEGFKKTIPKHRFMTLGKYLHLVDPAAEDRNDLLCKVRPLVTRLEQKFAEAYIPGKNITVDEGLVKLAAFLQAVHANEAR